MKRNKLPVLVLFLTVAYLFTGCGAVKIQEGISQDDLILAGTMQNNVNGTDFKEVARSASLALLMNEDTAEILLQDLQGGVSWRSNPADRASTSAGTEAYNYASSQLTLTYSTSDGIQTTLYSYKDSVEKGQYRIDPVENGVRVCYTLGTAEQRKRVPTAISAARFQEKFLDKLDEDGQKKLLRRYAYLDPSSIEDEQYRREMETRFPLSRKEPIYYLRSIPVPPNIEREVDAFAQQVGYTLEDLDEDNRANEIAETQQDPAFNIAVYYVLDNDRLIVRIPSSEIRMPSDALIETISVLDAFGAGGGQEEGYMLLPDGAGALVNFNNGRKSRSEYTVPIYGQDQGLSQAEQVLDAIPAVFPVFGVKKENAALFSVIEDGEAIASVRCKTAQPEQAYNLVYPVFTLRQKENVVLGSGQSKVYVFQTQRYQGDIVVSYYPLSGEQADYSGMAALYRRLLFGEDDPPRLPETPPLYLEFLGSVERMENLLGFPYKKEIALTTFQQVEQQAAALDSDMRENLQIRLNGWCNGGLNHTVVSSIRVQKELGGEKGLIALQAALSAQGIGLYPDIDWQYTGKTGGGFSKNRDAARLLNHTAAKIYPYNPATFLADQNGERFFYINAPSVLEKTAVSFLKAYRPWKMTGLSLGAIGRDVNADYNERRMVERQTAAEIQENQIAAAAAEGYSLLLRSGNAYSLPYASHVIEAPLESNGFDLADESIPFVPMVLSGHVQYAGKARNLEDGGRAAWLRCLETGAGLYYVLTAAPADAMKNTAYSEYYSVSAEEWMPTVEEEYRQLSSAMRTAAGRPIVRHEKLDDGVYKTTYQGGTEIIVNYTNALYSEEGLEVKAEGYVVRP